ncbi:hypothetical protein CTAM01_00519, partial [Colletotrichum tamarilloi]
KEAAGVAALLTFITSTYQYPLTVDETWCSAHLKDYQSNGFAAVIQQDLSWKETEDTTDVPIKTSCVRTMQALRHCQGPSVALAASIGLWGTHPGLRTRQCLEEQLAILPWFRILFERVSSIDTNTMSKVKAASRGAGQPDSKSEVVACDV